MSQFRTRRKGRGSEDREKRRNHFQQTSWTWTLKTKKSTMESKKKSQVAAKAEEEGAEDREMSKMPPVTKMPTSTSQTTPS